MDRDRRSADRDARPLPQRCSVTVDEARAILAADHARPDELREAMAVVRAARYPNVVSFDRDPRYREVERQLRARICALRAVRP